MLCQSFNTGPAVWLTEWNFPGARPPQVSGWKTPKVRADAQRDKDTAALGLELTDDEIARRYGDAWQRRRGGASASGAEPKPGQATMAPPSPTAIRWPGRP